MDISTICLCLLFCCLIYGSIKQLKEALPLKVVFDRTNKELNKMDYNVVPIEVLDKIDDELYRKDITLEELNVLIQILNKEIHGSVKDGELMIY